LRSLDFEETSIGEAIEVLRSRGACCDCEVLYNVVEASRLKEEYWLAQTTGVKRIYHDDSK
jgi:hypothetical protein